MDIDCISSIFLSMFSIQYLLRSEMDCIIYTSTYFKDSTSRVCVSMGFDSHKSAYSQGTVVCAKFGTIDIQILRGKIMI